MKHNRAPFIGIAVILLSTIAFLAVYRGMVNRRIDSLLLRPDAVPDAIVPMRFSVLSRANDVISARVTFLDRQGREIRTIERSWNGYELVFRIAELSVGDKKVPFPARIGTDELPSGLSIFGEYDVSGFPGVYGRDSLPELDRRELSAAFAGVRTTWFLKSAKKRLSYSSRGISDFEPGAAYSVTCGSDGKVSIDKD